MKSPRDAAFGLSILLFLTACLLIRGSLWGAGLFLLSLFVGLPLLEYLVLRRMHNDRWLRGSVLAGSVALLLGIFSLV